MTIPIQTTGSLTIIRCREVESRLGICRSTIYDKLNPLSNRYDPFFPVQVKIGKKSVGWLSHEIDAWILSCISASRDPQ